MAGLKYKHLGQCQQQIAVATNGSYYIEDGIQENVDLHYSLHILHIILFCVHKSNRSLLATTNNT